MNKRGFLQTVAGGVAVGALGNAAHAQHAPKTAASAVLLTVGGHITLPNRDAVDPALDRLLVKQGVAFSKARAFDSAALRALPAVTIHPTLEYDEKPHVLRGPLLVDVVKACGASLDDKTQLVVRAIDGYAVAISTAEAHKRRFIVATHLDGRPMALGGLGPLWVVYDADQFPDMAAKPVTERFALCPWAAYYVDVRNTPNT